MGNISVKVTILLYNLKKVLKLLYSVNFIVTLGLQPESQKTKEFTPKVVSVSTSVRPSIRLSICPSVKIEGEGSISETLQ